MSSAGLIMMLAVWTVVIIAVVYFFQKVVRTPQRNDAGGDESNPAS